MQTQFSNTHTALVVALSAAVVTLGIAVSGLFTSAVGAQPPSGTIEVDRSVVPVSEADGFVTLTLNRVGGSFGAVSITVQSADGTATIGEDYHGITTPLTLTWPDGNTVPRTITFPIIPDTLAEPTETFTMTVTGANAGTPAVTTVAIIDDPPGAIQFGRANYAVAEAEGFVTVTLHRLGGDSGQIDVDVQSANGTATSGEDYNGIPTPLTLTWPDGNTAPRTVTFPIIPDALGEGDETFTVLISGDHVRAPATTTVTIVDDDPLPDADLDTIPDFADNCPATANLDQSDVDADGVGDACDPADGRIPQQCAAFEGANVVIGTPGDDALIGTAGSDVIVGLGGNDTISGGDGRDCIVAGAGADIVNAGRGADLVFGGRGRDTLRGRAGNDNLNGGRGNDRLNGNAGLDTCRGGRGTDRRFSCEA